VPTDLDRPYWEVPGSANSCSNAAAPCGLLSAQPRIVCPRCQSEEFDWTQVSGKGKIHSYSIVWQTTAAGFQDEIPYVVCHPRIDEEPTRYVTVNLLVDESDYGKLDIDLPVVIGFEDRGEAVIPQWAWLEDDPCRLTPPIRSRLSASVTLSLDAN
jgi:uncharacterized OB-fold protein